VEVQVLLPLYKLLQAYGHQRRRLQLDCVGGSHGSAGLISWLRRTQPTEPAERVGIDRVAHAVRGRFAAELISLRW
jgi:hypothetical protein